MPIARFEMPDGRIGRFEVPEGTTPEQAQKLIAQHLSGSYNPMDKLKDEPKPDTGFTGAFKSSLEGLKGEAALLAGKTGLMDEAAAEKYYKEKEEEAKKKFKPTTEGWTEAPWEKFKETLGGSLPYMAAPLVAGAGVAAAPITGTAATIAGLGAAGLASATQFTGSNLARQMEEGKTLKETDLLAAGAAAIPQAALDTLSLKMIPGIGRIFGQAGKTITPAMAKQIAEQGILKTTGAVALQTGKTAGIEGATEAAQQLFERLQAGLSITDEAARSEYFDNFIGGAVLGGTLGGPGHLVERSRIKQQAAEEEYAKKQQELLEARTVEEQAKAAKAEQRALEQLQKAQQKTLGAPERPAEGVEGKTADIFGGAEAAGKAAPLEETITKTGERVDEEGNKIPEYGVTGAPTTTVKEREQAAQMAGVEAGPTYDEVARNKAQLEALAEQTTAKLNIALESGDTTAYRALAPQLENIRVAVDAATEQLKKLPKPEVAKDRATLEADLAKHQAAFKKYTGEAFDKAKLDKIANDIEATKEALKKVTAPAQAGFDFGAGAREDAEAAKVAKLEEVTAKKEPTLEPASEEDIAAYRGYNAKLNKLTEERKRLSELFDAANSSNDIRGAFDLKNLIAKKDTEIEAAKQEAPKAEEEPAKVKKELTLVQESRAIQKLRDQLKADDDVIKAVNPDDLFNAKGELTPYGNRMAGVQQRRDKLAAEIESRQAAFDIRNQAEGTDAALTGQIERAFPTPASKAVADVDVIGSMAALRQQIGTGVGLRGQLMGLRRRLQEARAKRNKAGKGIDRQEISRIIAEMRSVTEQIQDQDNVIADLPIPEKLPERTKKYYKALNEVRAKQRKALANYMDALEALHNREYIGGATKKAKATKQVLEKRVENAEITFANTMLDEVAIHRRVTGALPLLEKREEAFRNQYIQALKDVRKLAEGTLAAPESARAVIAEQIADITYVATRERAAKTKVEPLLKQQFASAEQETTADRVAALEKQLKTADPLAAKGIKAELSRIKEETPDVSNVGVPEQRDLFEAKELAPIATTRATHKNFMRFVMTQARKTVSAIKKADAVIAKAAAPTENLDAKVEKLRNLSKEYGAKLGELRADATDEAQAMASTVYAKKFYNEGLALAKQIYTGDIAEARTALGVAQFELNELEQQVKALRSPHTRGLMHDQIVKKKREYQNAKTRLENLYGSFEATIDSYRAAETQKLEKKYLNSAEFKGIKSLIDKNAKDLKYAVGKLGFQKEAAAEAKRAEEAVKTAPKESTPELIEAEQNMLGGLALPGVRMRKVTFEDKLYTYKEAEAKLKEMRADAKKLKEGSRQKTLLKQRIEELEKETRDAVQTVLTPEQKAVEVEKSVRDISRSGETYAKERAELKKRQAALREAEAKERKGYEKDINKLRDEYEALDPVKDSAARLALLKKAEPLFKKYRSLTPIERIPADEKSKRARGPATRDVTPPQLKTGVKAAPKTRVEAQNKAEADIAEGFAAERDFDYDSTGLSAAAFDDIVSDINNAKYRAEDAVSKGLTGDQAKDFISNVKLPKGLKVVVLNKLNMGLAARIQAQGVNPDTVKGGVLPNGTVFIVASNNANLKDLQKTLAHEVTGHLGVEGVIGEEGMRALAKRVAKQDGGVFALADKLGVGEDALGAYAAAKQMGKTDAEAADVALREVIAHTEEARVDKSFLAKAGEFIKAMVGLLRAGLRKMGIDLDINTNDVYKMLRDARKNFKEVTPGIYKKENGEIMFRNKGAKYGPGGEAVSKAEGEILATPKGFEIPKSKAEKKAFLASAALWFEQKFVRGSAGLMQALESKVAKDSLLAMSTKYFIAMYNQKHAWVGTALSKGVPQLIEKTRKDGTKETVLEAGSGANVKDIVEALSKADWGNAEGVRNVWSLHRIKLRADNVGLDKLNFTKDQAVTQKLLDDTEAVINAPGNEKLKAAIENADKIYNQYNRDLMKFLASTGAISKELAAKLVEKDDFVPYYRQKEDGTVQLDLGEGKRVNIGNIKTQPYLQQLVGGDERIVDAYTGILQNTNMIMDMALSNLATRNTAFALAETGLLEPKGSSDIVIRTGPGPASDKVLRFRVQPAGPKDTGERHVVVNTDAVGVPAQFVVEGLAGINTTVPTMFRFLGIPAQTLRKFVTVNPAYALRQVVKDPMVGIVANGLDTNTFLKTLKTFGSELANRDKAVSDIERLGIIGSNVFTGTVEDTQKRMLEIANGGPGFMSKLDTLALAADAATRQTAFNNFLKQGLSEMEAVVATYEMMPFTQRGTSRSLYLLSTTIPFLNAQIQGLNVLYKAMRGKATFQEKLRIKQKLFQRAALMAAATVAYAFYMQDDDAYKNATDDERYNNWFVYTPFSDQPLKIPTPFEVGILFKALPEAIVNAAAGDKTAGEAVKAMGKLFLAAAPIGPSSIPTAVKTPLEVMMNYSIYGQHGIVSERLKRVAPEERFTDNTTEIAKMVGGVTGKIPVLGEYLSPVQLDYLVRGYTGSTVIAVASLTNPIFRSSAAGEAPESRGLLSSDTPIIGGFFQPADANGLINRAYKDMEKVNQAAATYKKLEADGRTAEAEAYADKQADLLNLAPVAGEFRTRMGELAANEREVRSNPYMSPAEKRKLLEAIKQERILYAKDLLSARG